jgi:hypothetical protein
MQQQMFEVWKDQVRINTTKWLQIKEEIKCCAFVAGTFDGWSGLGTRFVSLTIHFLADDWSFQERWIGCTSLPGYTLLHDLHRLS